MIHDNGVGMTRAQIEKALDPPPGTKGSFGLSSVHKRLQLLYGTDFGLKILSDPGKGTTIIIRMPLHVEKAEKKSSKEFEEICMYKIMIADDEPIVLDSLKTFPWSDHQCCVTCFAENGLNALHTLESEKVDILISDIRMPGMNGLELSKAVKERSPETEIILLTGYAEFEYAKQALSLGIRQYLLKPFRLKILNPPSFPVSIP